MLKRHKEWAQAIRRDTLALYLAVRDPRTPWYARVVAAMVAAYALSPVDLIPDFLPVIGSLDDLILVPLGIVLAVRLIPPAVMAECRERARAAQGRPVSRAGAAFMVLLWLGASAWLLFALRGVVGV